VCAKTTFAEQVPGLTIRYGRRTCGLQAVLQSVALALGGRAGARLTGRLACSARRSTLLRLIRAAPKPAGQTPLVLGVDDFALRKVQLRSRRRPRQPHQDDQRQMYGRAKPDLLRKRVLLADCPSRKVARATATWPLTVGAIWEFQLSCGRVLQSLPPARVRDPRLHSRPPSREPKIETPGTRTSDPRKNPEPELP
jgi:hypothetical protein